MNQRPMIMNRYNMQSATERACSYVSSLLDLAKEIDADSRKEDRIKEQECRHCFYVRRMGGAAMTTRPCGCCAEEIMYGSTNTDALCKPCAIEHKLCTHCGGDIDMKVHRRNWPEIAPKELKP